MKEHIIYKYEAFDGTMFENEDECKAYEFAHQLKGLSLVLLDYKWQVLPIEADRFDEAYAVICNSQADIDFVKEQFEAEGYGHPFHNRWGKCEEKLGIYIFDERDGNWVNFDEKFAEIKDIYERCLACRH